MNKRCKHCHKPVEGRLNRLYCSAKCKSEHNNQLARVRNEGMRQTVQVVKQNRNILRAITELAPNQPIPEQALQNTGFQLGVVSGIGPNNEFLYDDYAIERLENKMFKILKVTKQ